MITCVFAVAAKGIVRDVETNNISIFSVYEQIRPLSFPVLLANFEFIAMVRRELSDPNRVTHTVSIAIDGDELFANQMVSEFEDKTRNRLTLRINGLVIPKPGILTVSLTNEEGNLETEYSIEVVAAPSRVLSSDSDTGGRTDVPDQAGEESRPT